MTDYSLGQVLCRNYPGPRTQALFLPVPLSSELSPSPPSHPLLPSPLSYSPSTLSYPPLL